MHPLLQDRTVLKVSEVSEILNISRFTIYGMITAKTMPVIVVGRRAKRIPAIWVKQKLEEAGA
jgi:excisionase family DNA binding protein